MVFGQKLISAQNMPFVCTCTFTGHSSLSKEGEEEEDEGEGGGGRDDKSTSGCSTWGASSSQRPA